MNLKNVKVFTSKFVGNGPSSYERRIYRAAVSQRLRNTAVEHAGALNTDDGIWSKTYISCEKYISFSVWHSMYAQLKQHRTPQKVTVLYNKQSTTALQPNVFLTTVPRFVVTNIGRSHFPSANHCQIQLQTPQSVIIPLKCVTNVSFRILPSLPPLFILSLYSDVTRETSCTPWKIRERWFMFKLQIKQTYWCL